MNITDFIVNRLQSFVGKFKNARARYEYDKIAGVHTIEIYPQSVYDSEDYLEWEGSMYDEFVSNFPGEVIGFISEDAIVGIKSVDFIVEGIGYAPYNSRETFSFNTNTVNILLSGIINSALAPSIATENGKDSFIPTIIDNNDYNFELRLAA